MSSSDNHSCRSHERKCKFRSRRTLSSSPYSNESPFFNPNAKYMGVIFFLLFGTSPYSTASSLSSFPLVASTFKTLTLAFVPNLRQIRNDGPIGTGRSYIRQPLSSRISNLNMNTYKSNDSNTRERNLQDLNLRKKKRSKHKGNLRGNTSDDDDDKKRRSKNTIMIQRSNDDNHKKEKNSILTNKSATYYPPWLQNTKLSDNETQNQNQNYINQANAKYNLYTLRQKLQYHHLANPKKFTQHDITSVINSVFVASENNIILVSSTALFLSLLLDVEEEYDTVEDKSIFDDEDKGREEIQGKEFMFMSKDTLVASSFHYCECVIAREMGIYDAIHSAMRTATPKYNLPSSRRFMAIDDDENNGNGDESVSNTFNSYNGNMDSNLMLMNMYVNNNMIWNPSLYCSEKNQREDDKMEIEEMPLIEEAESNLDENDITIEVSNGHSNFNGTIDQQKEVKKDSSSTIQPCRIQKESEDIIEQNLKITSAIKNNQIETINVSSFGPKAVQIYNNVAN